MKTHTKFMIDNYGLFYNPKTGEAGVSLLGLSEAIGWSERQTRRKLEETDEGKRYLEPLQGCETATGARVRYIPLTVVSTLASCWKVNLKVDLPALLEQLLSVIPQVNGVTAENRAVELGKELSVVALARELGYASLVSSPDGCKFLGRIAKQHYTEVRGCEPERKATYWNGKASSKPVYYERDRELLTEAIEYVIGLQQENLSL